MTTPFDDEAQTGSVDDTSDVESGYEEGALSRTDRRTARSRTKRRRIIAVCAGLVGIVVVTLGLFAFPLGGTGPAVALHVTSGESTSQIASDMAKLGIVSNATLFRADLAIFGAPLISTGTYLMPTNQSFASAADALAAGPNTVDVEPGITLREVGNQINNQVGPTAATAFATAVADGTITSPFQRSGTKSLEGLVAPGTYLVRPWPGAHVLVREMVARYNAMAASVGFTPTTTVRGQDSYAVATIASIVMKEGYYPVNMPKTSTVIYNRLAIGMALQMDSTVLYSFNQDGGTVTRTQLRTDTPYNTYLHHGLPPTPICVPSRAALDAAVHPPTGPWLFFTLISKDGTTAFSTTFAEQLANERLARARGIY